MAEGQGAGGASLVICEGAFEGTRYLLCAEETLIGRNPTTDITLLDESISREHAIVSMDEASGEYMLEDLQSTNGSKVNGKRIRSSQLAHGDEVEAQRLVVFDRRAGRGDALAAQRHHPVFGGIVNEDRHVAAGAVHMRLDHL